jgi:drug/metabolite transporter (DMT)-like permease
MSQHGLVVPMAPQPAGRILNASESASETRIGAAFALMIGATTLFPIGDTFSKLLTGIMDPLEVTFWRLAGQALALMLLALVRPARVTGRVLSPILIAGGAATALMLLGLIGGLAVMPLATAVSIFFTAPLILTVLSAAFLGEKVGWRRYAAVAAGFVGAIVVIRPNWATFGVRALLPLLAATAFAVLMVLVRRASATRSPLAIQVGVAVFALAIAGALLLAATAAGWFEWTVGAAPRWVWPVFAAMGGVAASSFLLMGAAYKLAPASVLAPTQYFEIVGAVVLGYLVFGDFPDALTWLGTAIILGSGLYVFHRERQETR